MRKASFQPEQEARFRPDAIVTLCAAPTVISLKSVAQAK
jgi:hypothetical protein